MMLPFIKPWIANTLLTGSLTAGGTSFEETRARLFGPGLQSVFQSAVGVSEDEVTGSRAGLRSMGTAVPLSELQVSSRAE